MRTVPRYGWDKRQEIQLAPVRPPISLKRNSRNIHPVADTTPVLDKHAAWSHNPPAVPLNPHHSHTGSKNSLAGQKSESNPGRDSGDELMFYQVDVNGLSELKQNTTTDSSSQDLPLPPISRQTSSEAKRRQKKIRKGVIDISTEMSVEEILIEILRVAVNLKLRSTDQSGPNIVKLSYRDISFTVGVTKETRNICNLNFQWLSGGDYTSYLGICEDMLNKLHL